MRPVLTPKQMRVLDAEAVIDGTSMDTLIARAGAAVARAACTSGGLSGVSNAGSAAILFATAMPASLSRLASKAHRR